METQTVGAIKGEVALVADGGGLLEFVVIRAGAWLIPITGPAGGPLAGMIGGIVGVETAIALWTPIGLVNEASDGGTPLVMMLGLE